jgi:hypothetical protein
MQMLLLLVAATGWTTTERGANASVDSAVSNVSTVVQNKFPFLILCVLNIFYYHVI